MNAINAIAPGATAMPAEPAEVRGSSRFVYESIYTAILEKRLAPATPLNKQTLGRIFQVSASTIQRALSRLADEGAVSMQASQVAMVARPCGHQARQVLEARILVETEVLRLVCGRLTSDRLTELRERVAEERACLAAGDRAGLIERVAGFHMRLAEFAGNPLLLKFLRNLLSRASLCVALNRSEVYSAATCEEHLELLEALEEGDVGTAVELLVRHLNGVFDKQRFVPPPTTDLRAAFKGRLGLAWSR
ncbi:GntR family transcriptional regulator [Metapseudomonas boanensis]|nr:GntR family transcriptional regulator [Pseudomonas boanensis]